MFSVLLIKDTLTQDEYCAATNSTNLNVTFVDIDCTFSKPELMATLEVLEFSYC